ncbi:MAG: arginase family protein, partial [Asticcacaulis sp.]
AGDVVCEGEGLERAQMLFARKMEALLLAGQKVVGLGGGHEIGWATASGWLAAEREKAPDARLGLINFDAHFDLRDAPVPTSGTPFLQALREAGRMGQDLSYLAVGISEAANTPVLFRRARETGTQWVADEACTRDQMPLLQARLAEWLSGRDAVYMTLCLDVLPAAVAPGVSAPSALGVAPDVVLALMQSVAESGKLRVMDVAELSPPFDLDHRTARTAARMIWSSCRAWR